MDLLRRSWTANRPLTLLGTAMVALLLATTVGLAVDDRVITGAAAWLKPAKFAVSTAIYSFTLVWLLTHVTGHPRLVRALSWVTATALGTELVLITGAAAAGTTSHFNVSTPLHAAVWGTMATAIVATWLAALAVGVLLLVHRSVRQGLRPSLVWALRLGVLCALVGMAVAFFMTDPTPEQLDAARRGAGMPIVGAHAVGVADGGPGLPLLGWSTTGGDLRAAHFLGLHGLQVVPLVAVLLGRLDPLDERRRTALVVTAGAAYLALMVVTAWQALRGQPLVAPDAATVTAWAAILAAVLVAAAVVLLPRSPSGTIPDGTTGGRHAPAARRTLEP